MGSQRVAAIATISHARNHFNCTQPEVVQSLQTTHFTVNLFLISMAFMLALVIIFIAFWLQDPDEKRSDPHSRHSPSIYTITEDLQECTRHGCPSIPPPPSYSDVISEVNRKREVLLEEVVTESCSHHPLPPGVGDNGLPSYEAAIMLKETKV